jgi:hypothetical protein
MKKVVALILALASTTAIAGNQNEDYSACKAAVATTFPDYKSIKIKRMRSSSMNLFVKFEDAERIEVRCDRGDHTIALKDGTPLVVAQK